MIELDDDSRNYISRIAWANLIIKLAHVKLVQSCHSAQFARQSLPVDKIITIDHHLRDFGGLLALQIAVKVEWSSIANTNVSKITLREIHKISKTIRCISSRNVSCWKKTKSPKSKIRRVRT